MSTPVPNKIAWEIRGYGIGPQDALFGVKDAAGNLLSFIGNDGTFYGPVAAVSSGDGVNHLQVEVDFGFASAGEGDIARTTVAATWVTAASKIICGAFAAATPEHDPDDVVIEGIIAYASNLVPGVGFDVIAYAPQGAFGRYLVNASGL